MIRCGAIPSEVRNPSQNWWVDHTLRTRGMPIRSSDRGLSPAEGAAANHFRHVRISTFRLLNTILQDPHLVHVFDQAFRAGVAADDAFPTFRDRHLAPWPAFGCGQLHVNKGALAVALAPVANRVLVRRATIGEGFDGFEAAKTSWSPHL